MKFLATAAYAIVVLAFIAIGLVGQPPDGGEVTGAVPAFDADRALADLSAIDALTREGGGRQVRSPGQARVIEYVTGVFKTAGLSGRVHRFDDMLGGSLSNVIGELPGRTDERIVLAAHHDTDGPGPAVVESGAGLAVLLETARALAASHGPGGPGGPLERTIVFASFDGESFGCAGSTRYVRDMAEEAPGSLRAAISLDSLGWRKGSPVIHMPTYTDRMAVRFESQDWLPWMMIRSSRRVGERLSVGDRYLSVPYQVLVRLIDTGYYSDDRPFVLAGVPGVFVSDFSLTRFYPYYGSPQDSIDRVGREQLGRAGRIITAAVHDLAAAKSLPAGERGFLLLPWPATGIRLTADHLRLLSVLMVPPGLFFLMRLRRRGIGRVMIAVYGAMAVLFLYGVLRIDPLVFAVVAGPVLLSAALLAIEDHRAVYGFVVSLIHPAIVAFILVPMMGDGFERGVLFGALDLGVLFAFGLLGWVLAASRMLSFHKAFQPNRPAGGERLAPAG